MLQYCCDRCRKLIDTDAENRFVLHLDLRKASGTENQEDPNDRDYLIEVDQILASEDIEEENDPVEPGCFRKSFDLCENCYTQYARNPLAVEATASSMGYTPN